MIKPIVVCIIGSSRFKNEILGLTQRETLLGKIAINHGFFHHADLFPITDEMKQHLDELMLRKIDLADEVLVADINSYRGNTTLKGVAYAEKTKKKLRYYSDEEEQRRLRQSSTGPKVDA